MAIVEPLPENVEQELRKLTGWNGEAKLAVSTDIDGSEKFGERWLIATDDTAYVFLNDDGKARLLHEVPLSAIENVNAEFLVGSGVLEVGVGGKVVDLLHYTHLCSEIQQGGSRPRASVQKRRDSADRG